jgi:hypothetical protein
MHPLESNLKTASFEEMEKRKSEIMKRMQILRRNGIENPQIWDQLELLLDSILQEQEERFLALNTKSTPNSVVVNTDPLPDDPVPEDKNPRNKNFTPVS